jgi:hypothetical protein
MILPVSKSPVMRNGRKIISNTIVGVRPSDNEQLKCEFCCQAKKLGYQGDCSVIVAGCDCQEQ